MQENFYDLKSALESKGLKVNLMKTKVMVSKIGQLTVIGLAIGHWQLTVILSSKNDPCGIKTR